MYLQIINIKLIKGDLNVWLYYIVHLNWSLNWLNLWSSFSYKVNYPIPISPEYVIESDSKAWHLIWLNTRSILFQLCCRWTAKVLYIEPLNYFNVVEQWNWMIQFYVYMIQFDRFIQTSSKDRSETCNICFIN